MRPETGRLSYFCVPRHVRIPRGLSLSPTSLRRGMHRLVQTPEYRRCRPRSSGPLSDRWECCLHRRHEHSAAGSAPGPAAMPTASRPCARGSPRARRSSTASPCWSSTCTSSSACPRARARSNAARMLDELRNRLSQVMKPGDYFARLGDRKFVFVLSNLRNEGHALLAANKILRTAAEPVSAGGQHATVRLSIGVALHPAHGRTPEQLMQCAETALLEAWKTQAATVVYTERKADGAGGRLGPRDPARERARARRPRHELPAEAVAAETRGGRLRGADALEPAGCRQRAAGDLHRRRRDDRADRPADALLVPACAAPARRVAEEPG